MLHANIECSAGYLSPPGSPSLRPPPPHSWRHSCSYRPGGWRGQRWPAGWSPRQYEWSARTPSSPRGRRPWTRRPTWADPPGTRSRSASVPGPQYNHRGTQSAQFLVQLTKMCWLLEELSPTLHLNVRKLDSSPSLVTGVATIVPHVMGLQAGESQNRIVLDFADAHRIGFC